MSTTNETLKPIKFSRTVGKDFATTLKKRAREYFKENNIDRYGNYKIYIKTVAISAMYFVPYGLMVYGNFTQTWQLIALFAMMGIGTAGIGMGFMHDANHGSYSKNETVSFLVGRVIGFVGGFAPTWIIQHNVLHHTYTNVYGHDEDVSPSLSILRFSPDDKWVPAHKWQYIYAWFFYGMMTIMWMTTKDFKQLYRYKRMGLTNAQNTNFNKLLAELVISKVLYYIFLIVIPMYMLGQAGVSWWAVCLLILMMHYIAGFFLGIVFQPAHVVPETDFVQAAEGEKDDLSIENNFLIHQLKTTADFAPKSRILAWFIGGLNYQVEHHLFPNICHVHYKELSKIVKQTAEDFDLPYHCHKTFVGALVAHGKMLKKLGKA